MIPVLRKSITPTHLITMTAIYSSRSQHKKLLLPNFHLLFCVRYGWSASQSVQFPLLFPKNWIKTFNSTDVCLQWFEIDWWMEKIEKIGIVLNYWLRSKLIRLNKLKLYEKRQCNKFFQKYLYPPECSRKLNSRILCQIHFYEVFNEIYFLDPITFGWRAK